MPEVLNIAGIEIEYDESLFDLNAIAENANEITPQKKKKKPIDEHHEKDSDDEFEEKDDTDEFFDPVADADNIVMQEPIAFDEYPFN